MDNYRSVKSFFVFSGDQATVFFNPWQWV